MYTWEKNIRKVIPYTPGDQPNDTNMIKLNTNENPYPPAKGIKKILESFDTQQLKLYPDPKNTSLVQAIAKHYQVNENQVFVGVGSDDVIAMSFMTFFNSEKPILFPDITYSFYDVWASMLKIPYETISLDEEFLIKPSDYKKENGGIIFPNPNAPTGIALGIDSVQKIIEDNQDVIVIVDEAYVDFGGETALPLVNKYENVLVVQTFSKSRQMAGSRIGFAIGNPVLIKYLNDVKYAYNSYTMDRITLEIGVEAIRDDAYFKETIQKIIDTREYTKTQLKELGFEFTDSKANFIFATHPNIKAKHLYEALKKEHIYVRYFEKARIDNYLRITIGTQQEMEAFVAFLKQYSKQYM